MGIIGICMSIANVSLSVDGWGNIFSYNNVIPQGRWVYHLIYNNISQSTLIPVLSPIIAIGFMVLAGLELCSFWGINDKSTQVIATCLFTLHPYLIDMYNFVEAQIPYPIGYFLMATALNLTIKKKVALATALMFISLGTYQIVLCLGLSAIAVFVLNDLTRKKEIRITLRSAIILLAVTFAAVFLYLIFNKALLALLSLEPGERVQDGFISTAEDFITKIGVFIIVISARMLPVGEFVISFFAKALILILIIAGFITALYQTRITAKSNLMRYIICTILFFSMPFIAFAPCFPLASHALPFRISTGFVVFIAGMFAIAARNDNRKISSLIKILGTVLVLNFIFTNNILLLKQYMQNQRDIAMANRIAYRMESLPEYQPGMKLKIFGNLSQEKEYKKRGNFKQVFVEYFNLSRKRRYSVGRGAFETEFSKYTIFTNYLKMPLKADQNGTSLDQNMIGERKAWPAKESVFISDNCIVVILSNAPRNKQYEYPDSKRTRLSN